MSAKELLLTPSLRQKVSAAVEDSFLRAEKHYKKKFPRPEVRFDIRNTNGGEAWMKRNLIRLNLTFLVENEKDFLASTVPHEVAHLVAHHVYDSKPMNGKKVKPHGKEWREAMEVLGLPPKTKHTYDLTSLDLHKRKRVKRIVGTREKIANLLKTISRFDEADREFIVQQIRGME